MKFALVTAVLVLCNQGWAQPAPIIARSDVVDAQLRFEQQYAAHPPADVDRAQVHRAYDEATQLLLGTRQPEGLAKLNALTDSLDGAKGPANEALIRSLQVRISPPIARSTRQTVMRIRVARMYEVPLDKPVDMRLIIRTDDQQPKVVLDEPLKVDPNGPPFQLTRSQPKVENGRYLIELVAPDGTKHPAGEWHVTQFPLDTVRIAVERRLSALAASTPQMAQSMLACRARNMLLTDRRDENNAASFLADTIELTRDVQSEVGLLEQGQDPYMNRPGELWRAFGSGLMEIPARVYAPPGPQNRPPMPLLIVLHDLGGDENTMLLAGNGRLRKLADEHGLLIVTPHLHWVMRNPMVSIESIVDAMTPLYNIESTKIYLMGHGSGAMLASTIAAHHKSRVSKLVLFSGADFTNASKLPPTLLYAGQLDALFTPELSAATMKQAQAAKLPVELREQKDSGHYLVVHDNLAEAVEWLMK
jgi:predicted esterase